MKSLVVLVLLAGCNLYMGGDDDDDICAYGADIPAQLLRDPFNGQCEATGGGSCGCGVPCTLDITLDTSDWATCSGACEALAEDTCIATPGCRAAYQGNPAADQIPQFLGCWEVAPSGPIDGECTGLDALACSRHDNCSAYYETRFDNSGPEEAPALQYLECFPENHVTSCGTVACGPGYHCDDGQCIADPPACETLATESACTARQDCEAVYDGHDCTCTPEDGCHCQSQTFNHCQTSL